MAAETDRNGHVVAIQRADSEVEIHTGVSAEDAIELVSRADEALAGRLKEADERIRRIAEEILPDPDKTVEYFLFHYAQSKADDLLALDLDTIEEQAHRTRVDEYHRYGRLGTVLLYRDRGFSGGSKFFTVTWPNFKWSPYRFNDVASSGKAWGGNIIFEHTWYKGRRLYMVGVPYFQLDDFNQVEFNDLASSMVTFA